jgi:hypothetical protein
MAMLTVTPATTGTQVQEGDPEPRKHTEGDGELLGPTAHRDDRYRRRRGMAFELRKRMVLDRATKNAVITLVWSALSNSSVIAVLLAYPPSAQPVRIPNPAPEPKVESQEQNQRVLIAN